MKLTRILPVAAAGVLCAVRFGWTGAGLTVFAFFCVLVVAAFRDLDTMEIPDGCHLALLVLAGISLLVMPEDFARGRLAGAVCVSVPMLLLALAVPGAFGGGDIKLMAAGGLFLGLERTLAGAAVAVLLGGVYGIYLLASGKKTRKDHFAFGPFLCIGMAVGTLWGEQLADWYLGFLMLR